MLPGTRELWKYVYFLMSPLSLGNQFLGINVAEIQLLTNHLCKHCLLALDL
jgi:hypothetical protein